MLLARTAVLNLTAARTHAEIASHIADSLLLVDFVRSPLVDVGSGGGFPAIPLAIATGAACTLIESVAKKAAFLRDAARELELDITVLGARAEDVAREPAYRGQFATATARAVGPATTVLELTIPLLAVGGTALLQRGRLDAAERRALADASLVLGAQLEPEIADPASDDRRVVVARKVAPTGPRFPRRAGVPAKRPLCWTPTGESRDA